MKSQSFNKISEAIKRDIQVIKRNSKEYNFFVTALE